jgi:hypothetical protein
LVNIELAAMRALVTSALGFPKQLRVAGCTHWPERRGCAQACLSEVDVSWAREHGLLAH